MELLNKITTKGCDVQPKSGDIKEGEKKPLLRIFGRATGCQLKTSDYGESFCFKGTFEAIRLSDGEVFRSAKVYLPRTIEGLLADALSGESNDPVDFAVEVGVKYAKNAYGYEWTVNPLIQNTGPADMLAHLREAASSGLAISHEKSETSNETKAPAESKKGAKA